MLPIGAVPGQYMAFVEGALLLLLCRWTWQAIEGMLHKQHLMHCEIVSTKHDASTGKRSVLTSLLWLGSRQSVPRGQRHVNAALGRQRAGVFRDPFAERCVEAAAERFGADAVSAAADLMVLSVERRWGPA